MKNMLKTSLFAIIFFWNNVYSQSTGGSDIIICLDNSGSIDTTEFSDMTTSTKKLIWSVLRCNPNNRVSVIHYGTSFPDSGTIEPKIYIESDFTNNITIANTFSRRLNSGDHFHEAVGLIGNALDNISNGNIVSPQTTLTNNPSRPLVIFLFTDAERANGNLSGGSFLIKYSYPILGIGNNNAFTNFTNFKNTRSSKFAIVHVSNTAVDQAAAAGIASLGGTYTGPNLEVYTADPNSGQYPRLYLNKTNFLLTDSEVSEVSTGICTIANGNIKFYHEPISCKQGVYPFNVSGSYTIPAGATITNFKMSFVNIATGVVYPTAAVPSYTSPNQFSFHIDPSNLTNPLAGQYKFQATLVYSYSGASFTVNANNGVPGLPYDIQYCCPDHLYIDTNVTAPNTDLQSANNTITAVNVISDGAQADYHAGDFVLLSPGFNSQNGSDFFGHIEGCKPNEVLKSDNETYYPNPDTDPNNLKQQTIENIQQKKFMQISPNPNNGIFTISVDKIISGMVQISDINGKTVFEKLFNNEKEISVNIQTLPSATYIVKVVAGNEIFTQKIIKR